MHKRCLECYSDDPRITPLRGPEHCELSCKFFMAVCKNYLPAEPSVRLYGRVKTVHCSLPRRD